MRTNIEIDDALMAEAMKITGFTTKKQVVEEGLRALIRLARQREVAKSFGKIPWDGDLDDMRTSKHAGLDTISDAA